MMLSYFAGILEAYHEFKVARHYQNGGNITRWPVLAMLNFN